MVFFAAKGLSFILSAQATLLWWALERRPTNPQGVTFSLDNLKVNAPGLFHYLDTMRWTDIKDLAIDSAGLSVGGLLLRKGAPLAVRIAAVIATRGWVADLLGTDPAKGPLGIFPELLAPAVSVGTQIVEGGLGLVTKGLGVASALSVAWSTGNIIALGKGVREIEPFVEESLSFLTTSRDAVAEVAEDLGIQVAEVGTTIRDMAVTAYLMGIMAFSVLGRIYRGPQRPPPPVVLQKLPGGVAKLAEALAGRQRLLEPLPSGGIVQVRPLGELESQLVQLIGKQRVIDRFPEEERPDIAQVLFPGPPRHIVDMILGREQLILDKEAVERVVDMVLEMPPEKVVRMAGRSRIGPADLLAIIQELKRG